ncbi:4-hydroxybenzoate polyprenyltransferase mitochondrial-like isoform X2 [Biomphalaria pfeifferi]|uniref:4-hydroxybenzoate polyprenyltransferase, mitochondrial n=1 Tax=Biomphalaria pfeifferi TaxID=112525 RepID=A0AAD8C090_BIOPF|nr:4-hydroxybenzoate polyprenyltransferase mitochondrial-like isoform X2 [Biomphalaria pfeifferi]
MNEKERLCDRCLFVPTRVSVILLAMIQGGILNYFLIHYQTHNWYAWIAGDVAIIFSFFVAFFISFRELKIVHKAKKYFKNHLLISTVEAGSFPLVYFAWLVYSVIMAVRVGIIYKSLAFQVQHELFFDRNLLKVTVAFSGLVFLLLVASHHNFGPGTTARNQINFLSALVPFDIIDAVDILSIFFFKEDRDTLEPVLAWFIIIVACLNLLLPTVPLMMLSKSHFGAQPITSQLEYLNKLIHIFVINLPLLAIRLILWQKHRMEISPLLVKNVFMIVVLGIELHEKEKTQQKNMDDIANTGNRVGSLRSMARTCTTVNMSMPILSQCHPKSRNIISLFSSKVMNTTSLTGNLQASLRPFPCCKCASTFSKNHLLRINRRRSHVLLQPSNHARIITGQHSMTWSYLKHSVRISEKQTSVSVLNTACVTNVLQTSTNLVVPSSHFHLSSPEQWTPLKSSNDAEDLAPSSSQQVRQQGTLQAVKSFNFSTTKFILDSSPHSLQPYLRLIRFDKPIGTWLLYWPCTWSIALAAPPGCMPDLKLLSLFGAGAFFMRGAGCIINDIWDKDFDKKVARTKTRPLASGELTYFQALVFLGTQLSCALAILLQLNTYSIYLGVASMGLVIVYPLCKRFTYWPQIMLGLTLNWGVLLAWSALRGSLELPGLILYLACTTYTIVYDTVSAVILPGFAFNYGALMGWAAVRGTVDWQICLTLYFSSILWTLVYDTIYAHQDKYDDMLIGVKSTAIRLGEQTKPWMVAFTTGMTAGLTATGFMCDMTWPYYTAVGITALRLAQQLYTVRLDDADECAKAFRGNFYLGAVMFFGIIFSNLLKPKENVKKEPKDVAVITDI